MAKPKREQCPVVYQGKSCPQFHGTRCTRNGHPHIGLRHLALLGEGPLKQPLEWWTEEEKAALRGC